MHPTLISKVLEDVPLTEEDKSLAKDHFTEFAASSSEILVDKGMVATHMYFIAEGFVSVFHEAHQLQVVSHLSGPGEFITSFDSFVSQHSSQQCVKCLTRVRGLKIPKHALDHLYALSGNWASYIRLMVQRFIKSDEERAINFRNLSDADRISEFMKRYPDAGDALPHELIARYLGVTTEDLNRFTPG